MVEDRHHSIPEFIPNWIDGHEQPALSGEVFLKLSPVDGSTLCKVARSVAVDIARAVEVARRAQVEWASMTPVQRGDIIREIALSMRQRKRDIAEVVACETGKSFRDAFEETAGAIELGMFMGGEGRRFYGRTTTSAIPNRSAMVVRQPLGVAGLIVPANTPIANVAWKVFPALLCGNAAVLKSSEDSPATSWIVAQIAHQTGLPLGVLNVVHGYGEEAGASLVAHPHVDVISFTGSCEVGRVIQRVAGERLAKVCLEMGGKNPLIVCDDADLGSAAKWVLLSAFSNAGQRCSSGSRIIIFEAIYDSFREMLIEGTRKLRVGPSDDDDFGPVINETQLTNMLVAVEKARAAGGVVLTGGHRMSDRDHRTGFYMAPTMIENVSPEDEISRNELFGPITCLYRVKNFEEALALANNSPFGLTASIHTRSIHRAMRFIEKARAGVVVVNSGTYGSEPHMPFGGVKNSGTGWREPGTEALDVYSDLKTVYINHDPAAV